jgi:putative hydroxymethylpyrimidine transport system ATP-binding protein
MDPIINIKNLTKSFFDILTNDYTVILNDIDFYINEGEIVSLIGPSGCGKSTLLNIISGLEDPDRGEIAITNIDVDNRLGELSYMQQKDLLLPWKTVLGNSILGLEILNKDNYFPNQISGGMRQRASFLRTILTDKKILLLDEPFSSLDSITRLQMQQWLLELWRKFSKTILLVTHDIDEAIFLSDRIYVMKSHLSTSINVIKVDLRRPRNREVVLEQSFLNIKKQILPMLGNEYG